MSAVRAACRMKRRDFLAVLGAASFADGHAALSPLQFKLRQQPPWAAVGAFIEPGLDEFPGEKSAMEIERSLEEALRGGALPLAPDCHGASPLPARYRTVAPDVAAAVFEKNPEIASGWTQWRASLGEIRSARFHSLPGNAIRYDIRSRNRGRLEQRIGLWRQEWSNAKIVRFEPEEELLTHAERPWFRDITSYCFEEEPCFAEQLARGIPHWRARLDPACGLDVYGENGIAVADIDGDGVDEIYVCQPGGLPNRLFKNDGSGRLRDISSSAGLDLLDNTNAALFVDLRNSGRQDLVLVKSSQPLLFLNDGKGKFTLQEDAFRFASRPLGAFTSVAAADYDRDGRLDLYFCCYVHFQSEAQYSYPVPYHDARNGPPNFLFRNRLHENPSFFEDVTASSGIDHNNRHFSFAAAWCDYNADGWPDLYVTNDFGRKNLYRNDNGKFRDVAEEAGVVDLGPGMSAAWIDYDGDGRPDLLVSNMWSASGQRIVNDPAFGPVAKDPSLLSAYRSHVKGNSLYRNNGDGTFTYTGREEGIEICPWSWSCDGADFDNDGSPELYIACGMVGNGGGPDLMSYFYRQVVAKSPVREMAAPEYENGWNAINQFIRQDYSWASPEPNMFFVRRGGRFYDFSGVSGADQAEDSRSFALTDIDGDGNLDIVLKSRRGPQVRVLQNDCGTGRKSIAFSLHGEKSNRDAIGARVEVDGQTKWLTAGSGYLSQGTKRLIFGLADRPRAERISILWPSGLKQDLPPLAAGFLHRVVEGSVEIQSTPFRARKDLPAGPTVPSDNEAKLHTTWLWEPVPLPENRKGPSLLVVHAGEPLAGVPAGADILDLRAAPADLVAAYAIFRRYLFDYRTGLVTPLWLLVDSLSRVRKIYATPPGTQVLAADLAAADGPVPDPKGLPFQGRFTGRPYRDYYKFGGALLQAGYPERALPYLEEMLRRTPNNARALLAVGRVHFEAGRLSQARAALEKSLSLDPNLPAAWNDLGGVESQSGRDVEALRCYEKALALLPDQTYVLLNVAQAQAKLGRRPDAEKSYRRVLELDPRSGDAANGLGLLLARQGRNAEARKLFETAISIRRDDASAINNLGVLYMQMGQPNDAIAAFRYGIQAAPDDETLYLNLARVWIQSGKPDNAREVMKELLARKPESAVAQKALKELGVP